MIIVNTYNICVFCRDKDGLNIDYFSHFYLSIDNSVSCVYVYVAKNLVHSSLLGGFASTLHCRLIVPNSFCIIPLEKLSPSLWSDKESGTLCTYILDVWPVRHYNIMRCRCNIACALRMRTQLSDEVITRLKEFMDQIGRNRSEDYETVLNMYSTYRNVRNILATYSIHVDPA